MGTEFTCDLLQRVEPVMSHPEITSGACDT